MLIPSDLHLDTETSPSSQKWDSRTVSNAVVKYLPDGLPKNPTDNADSIADAWRMWYTGTDADGARSVGIATSIDGVTWTRDTTASPILAPNAEDWFYCDTASVEVTDVAFQAGVFWLMYDAEDKAGARRVAVALSQDGTNFARYEAEHSSGAMFVGATIADEMPTYEVEDRAGNANKMWDVDNVGGATQVFAGPKEDLRLYYHAETEEGTWGIGVARSADGVRWIKVVSETKGMVLDGGRHPCVVPVASSDGSGLMWVMVYEEEDDQGRVGIALATSRDGMKEWGKEGMVLTAGGDGAWDCGGVGRPNLVRMAEGKWRLYYTGFGSDGHGTGIGLALGETEEGSVMPSEFVRRKGV